MITDYSDREGGDNYSKGERAVSCQSSNVPMSWKERFFPLFEHIQSFFRMNIPNRPESANWAFTADLP